jgi:hypothetical protein
MQQLRRASLPHFEYTLEQFLDIMMVYLKTICGAQMPKEILVSIQQELKPV